MGSTREARKAGTREAAAATIRTSRMTADRAWESRRGRLRREGRRGGEWRRRPGQSRRGSPRRQTVKSLPEELFNDLAAESTESEAQADLALAQVNVVAERAVEADAGERERRRCKEC